MTSLHVLCRNEDFYQVIQDGAIPNYDILLTNPPFSGDHVERLIRFCANTAKPWALLLPSYVHRKQYFDDTVGAGSPTPFFVVPRKRYNYWTPRGVSRNNAKVRKDGRTSPFVTFWYAFGFAYHILAL
jgi:hypothetical protein